MKVPGGEHWLRPGQAIGDVDEEALKRQMIRRTIKEHLDKEKRLRPLGIKVLSLFFVDVVAHYRSYTAEGQAQKGKYAVMFEEEYKRLPHTRTTKRSSRKSIWRATRAKYTAATSRSIKRRSAVTPSKSLRTRAATARPMTTPTTSSCARKRSF